MFHWPVMKMCKLFGKCQEVQSKMQMHHKVPLATATYFTADKTFDMSREHIFLAAHEFATHAKLLTYTLTGSGMLLFLSIIAAIFWTATEKKE